MGRRNGSVERNGSKQQSCSNQQSDPTTRSTETRPHQSDVFKGFGPSLISDVAFRPLQHLNFTRLLATARREVRQNIPICPGVYGWLNSDGSLIYVGKSKSLRHRLATYFATETSDPKMAKIRNQSHTLVWESISHEVLALIREQELIDRWRPPYNVAGKPERRQPGFVCISKGLAPSAFFARQIPKRAAESYGPIAGRASLGQAITSLNYAFQLRDCPDKIKMQFSNQLQLFGNNQTAQCLRYELESCPAPCAGNCSHQAYRHNVDKALRFLKGRDNAILDRLEERMKRAAEQKSFERACVLRDQWKQLRWLSRRIKQLTTAQRKLNGVWVLPGFDHQHVWMFMRAGQLIQTTAGRNSYSGKTSQDNDKQLLHALETIPLLEPTPPTTNLQTNLLLMLASWTKKYPELLSTMRTFEDCRQDCRQAS